MQRLVQNSSLALAAVLTVTTVVSSCFLTQKKSNNSRSPASSLIDRENVYIDRVGDGTSALVKFKSSAAAFCELTVYSQDGTSPPTKDKPVVLPCSGTDARVDFREQIPNLKVDVLYIVEIRAWTTPGGHDQGEVLVVKETVGANPSNPTNPDAISSMYVLRFNTPLRSAEAHRIAFPTPTNAAAIRTATTPELGCKGTVPAETAAQYSLADKDIQVASLASQGFGQATATVHPSYPERQKLFFNTMQFANPEWVISYAVGGQSDTFRIKSAARFTSVEVEGKQIVALAEAQLGRPEDSMAIDPAKPINIKWQFENILDPAYVVAQIGRSNQDKAVFCVFDAKKGSGSIDVALVQALDAGKQVFSVALETTQFIATKGWLVRNIDWRSTRIEKP